MTTIKLNFDKDYMILDIVDSVVADIWLDIIGHKTQNNMQLRSVSDPHYISPQGNEEYILQTWNSIKQNISTIEKEFNVKWPEQVPDKFTFDQQLLNRYHRYFAQSTMFYNRWQVNFDDGFAEIPDNMKDRFSTLLEEMNCYIHVLESFLKDEVTEKYLDKIQKLHLSFDDKTWINIPKYTPHTADENLNVCLAMEVHGKNYLQAFIDNDDPSQLDIHGQRGLFGCLDIYTDNSAFEILNSKDFHEWLGCSQIKDYGLIQLGKVIDSSDQLTNFSKKMYNPINVEFLFQ